MSECKTPDRQALTDSIALLRTLRDQLDANLANISHPSLDVGGRRLVVDIQRSLLVMADTSAEARRVFEVFRSLPIAGIIASPILPMDPQILLSNLDTIVELVGNVLKDGQESNPAASVAPPVLPVIPVPKKRGRPAVIPHQRKDEALAAKAAGRPNSEVARILYAVKHASDRQIRNVPSILNHYKRSKPLPDLEKCAPPEVPKKIS